MEAEVVERLKSFSLSKNENGGVDLKEEDVQMGVEEGQRSLLGRVFGDKKANFQGLRNTFTKLWQYKGLCKVKAQGNNMFQFVFSKASDRDAILAGRPWYFDNQLLILHSWSETLTGEDTCFQAAHIWIQVWQIPSHWISIETGKKIGSLLGKVMDVLLPEMGGRGTSYLKLLVEVDFTKPLMRGTKLRFKQTELWIQFKYEQLPVFCFYCGCVGHHERACLQRKEDLSQNCLKGAQFGSWLRADLGFKLGGAKPAQTGVTAQRDLQQNQEPPGDGTGLPLSEGVLGKGTFIVGEGGLQGSLPCQQAEPLIRRELQAPSIATIIAEPMVEARSNLGAMGLVSIEAEGCMSGVSSQDLMVVDAAALSLQEYNPIATLSGLAVVPKDPNTGAARLPLSDCTNLQQPEHQISQLGKQNTPKGHWKRMARSQGQQAAKLLQVSQAPLDSKDRKRDRAVPEGVQDSNQFVVDQDHNSSKKAHILYNTEVEETSLNWSRPIR